MHSGLCMGWLFISLATCGTLMDKLLNKADFGEFAKDNLERENKVEVEETGVLPNPVESTFQSLQQDRETSGGPTTLEIEKVRDGVEHFNINRKRLSEVQNEKRRGNAKELP